MSKTEQKFKVKSRWDSFKEQEGTVDNDIYRDVPHVNLADQEDSDIYKMIEKYNCAGIVPKRRNETPMYLDMTGITGLTLDEAIRQRKQMEEYYVNMPSKVRKIFGDDFNTFYTKYKQGDFNNLIETGVLTKEQADKIMEDERAKFNETVQEQVAIELAKQQQIKEQQTEGESNNA